MPNKKAAFQLDWINPDSNEDWAQWLLPSDKDTSRAFCKICQKSFSLSNMGRQAVLSHSTSTKHLAQKKIASSSSLRYFLQKPDLVSPRSITSPVTVTIAESPPTTSGFSVNEQLLVENLQERSLVNQRVVYDSIKAAGGVSQVDICSEMLKFVRSSGTRYNQALDENRQKSMHETEHISKKRRAQIELKELEDKKRKLDEVAKAEKASIDMKMAELKKLM